MKYPTKNTAIRWLLLSGVIYGMGGLLATHSLAVDRYKPYILAQDARGDDVNQKAVVIKEALRDQNFQIVGEYQPFKDAYIIAITDDELIKSAGQSACGPFGVAQRVALTKVKNNIQVSYANPTYLAYAYRMKNNLGGIAKKLETALGKGQDFGSQRGKTDKQLNKYHYTFGMEYCTNVHNLAEYKSYGTAIDELEKGLAAKKGGVSKVYRIDLPDGGGSIFGVGMTEGYSSDKLIFSKIDYVSQYKHTAHLPYEIWVQDNGKIVALHTRFRVAISWPDLKMAGDPSFLQIIKAPEDIEKALTLASGKEWKPASSQDDDFNF